MRSGGAASAVVVLAGLLAGCSGGEEKAVPELPERICWEAFASADVVPILPPGDKATLWARPFVLTEEHDARTCSVSIDGATKFLATAMLLGSEEQVDWDPVEKADPQPIDMGTKGIIWDAGAATYYTCEPPLGSTSRGRYVDLFITTDSVPDKDSLPAVLPGLLEDFITFTRDQLECESDVPG
ncbi:hypothetical protein [Streptomyces sp. NPDC090026]|uniref:hypothetical protein n=1 Tax=Streptomyces sp. NPDC090026 TaxID=3365923 RepID=UPI00382FE2AD